jgi:hypothetical protein
MIREVTRITRKAGLARKQTKKVKLLMEQYKRNGLLSKEKYDEYMAMINEQEKVIEDAKKKE